MSIKKRHPIRDSEIRSILNELKPKFGEAIENLMDEKAEMAELESGETVILSKGKPILVQIEEGYIPLIFSVDKLSMKKVTVDMGAVSPISSGADIMVPGIVNEDKDIEKNDIVGIQDEENEKIIVVGRALEDGPYLKKEEGKVIKNIHYVGDRFWDLLKKV